MAAIVNTAVIGNFTCRVTRSSDEDSAYGKLRRYDKAMENAGHAEMHAMPASFFVWFMAIFTAVPDGGSGNSVKVAAPRPLTVWAGDFGAESSAGATGVLDLRVDPTDSADASMMAAAVDVKTTVGVAVRAAPEAGPANVAYGSLLYLRGTSGAGGTIVGAQAHLYCQLQ